MKVQTLASRAPKHCNLTKLFKFPLEESIFDINEVPTCQLNIVVPDSWYIFMNYLFGKRSKSDDFDRKSYVLFKLI